MSDDSVSKVLDHALLLVKASDAIIKALQYRKRALALVAQLRRGRANVRTNLAEIYSVVMPQLVELKGMAQVVKLDEARLAAERDAALSQLAEARALLESAYYQLDPIYLADGATLHPGCVSTLHELYEYLWPEGKAK